MQRISMVLGALLVCLAGSASAVSPAEASDWLVQMGGAWLVSHQNPEGQRGAVGAHSLLR